MTDNNHPITLPPELVRQLLDDDDFPFQTGTCELLSITKDRLNHVITQAARWGADQELEACCEWFSKRYAIPSNELRDARRPKPPTLKEQALAELDLLKGDANAHGLGFDAPAIRRALMSLPDEP